MADFPTTDDRDRLRAAAVRGVGRRRAEPIVDIRA